MFETLMANPLNATEGSYVIVAQRESDAPHAMRYAIINSDTLLVRAKFSGESAKKEMEAEIVIILAEKTPKSSGSLEEMLAGDDALATALAKSEERKKPTGK